MNSINIEGMEFYAYHGHFKEEQQVGNKFIVDIKLKTDLSKAAESDELDDTVNYVEIYNLIQTEMKSVSNLLENLGGRIINSISNNFPMINEIELKVSKINPPIGGKINRVSVFMKKKL